MNKYSKILELFYREIVPEAASGKIRIANNVNYAIIFNTKLLELKKVYRKYNDSELMIPTLIIDNKREFDRLLCEYTIKATSYYDDSNLVNIINFVLSFIALILSILLKVISAPTSDIIWSEYAKLYVGSFILIPSISIVFLINLTIVFRSLILKKTDEKFDEPEETEIVSTSSETQIDDNEYLINEFNNK